MKKRLGDIGLLEEIFIKIFICKPYQTGPNGDAVPQDWLAGGRGPACLLLGHQVVGYFVSQCFVRHLAPSWLAREGNAKQTQSQVLVDLSELCFRANPRLLPLLALDLRSEEPTRVPPQLQDLVKGGRALAWVSRAEAYSLQEMRDAPYILAITKSVP